MPAPVSAARSLAEVLELGGGTSHGELAALGPAWEWRGAGEVSVLGRALAQLAPAQIWHVIQEGPRRPARRLDQEWHGVIEADDLRLIHRAEVLDDTETSVAWDGQLLAIESVHGSTLMVPVIGIWEELFWSGNSVSIKSKRELTEAVLAIPRRAAGVLVSLISEEIRWLEAAAERPETGAHRSREWDTLAAEALQLSRGLGAEEVGMIETLAPEWERTTEELVGAARGAMAPARGR